jgi:hypothetical protein
VKKEEQDKGPSEPCLIVKGGHTDGYSFPLQQGMSILVGSGRLAQLRVGTDEIGSAHMRVTWDDNGISVTDNGSITGTFVNGEQVETAVLWDGDHLAFVPPGTKKQLPRILVRIPPGTVQVAAPPPDEKLTAPPPPERPPTPRPAAGARPGRGGRALPRFSLPGLPNLPRLNPVVIGAVAGTLVLMVVLIVLAQKFLFSTPVLEAVRPDRAETGATVMVSGKRFALDPARNTVWFGDKSVAATASTGATLVVTVPEAPESGNEISVSVETPGGRSKPLAFYIQTPLKVTSFLPEAALPGDEVTAKGQGFAEGTATVTVAGRVAKVIEARRDGLRFRLPEVAGEPGTLVPVMVQVGDETAKPVDLVLGRLPVVLEASPPRAAPGERVTIRGLGFSADASSNAVTVGGAPALVLSASPRELQILVPAPGGDQVMIEAPVVVRTGNKASTNRAVLGVSRQVSGTFILRFFPAAVTEGVIAQAFVASEVGPLLLLSTPAGAPSVAERAVKVSAALNAALERARSGQAVVFEGRTQPSPGVGVRGSPDLVAPATPDDAAGYAAPPQGVAARGGAPPLDLLVEFWAALLNDYVAVFVTNEKPVRVLSLSPRGRALVDLRSVLGARGAISGQRVSVLGPELLERLRDAALIVPEQGQGVALAAIEGLWEGEMQETGSGAKAISVRLRAQGPRIEGTLTNRAQAVAMDVALKDVSFDKGTLKFVLPVGTAARTFVGVVDGGSVSGTIHASPGGPAVGRFSLRNVP